jgi:hypothetical protein
MESELEHLRWQLKALQFDNDALHRQRLADAAWRGANEPKIQLLADYLERCVFGKPEEKPSSANVQRLLDEVRSRGPAPIARSLLQSRVRTDL